MNVNMSALYGAIVNHLVLSRNTAQLKSDLTGTVRTVGTNYRIHVSHFRQKIIILRRRKFITCT